MKKYESYKDSGVEWIGEIPSGWKILRNKYFTVSRKEKSETGEEELLSVSEYHGVIPRRNIREGEEHLTRSESLEGYLKVYNGDLVSNIMLMWKRGLGVSEYEGIVSPAYSVFSFNNSFPKYFHYLLRTDQYVSEFKRNSTGVIESRLRLYDDSFGSLHSHFPPLSEQQQIVSYLDTKTSLIDTLIEKTKLKIQLLKENRTSLINEVVTKGLNPNVEMKDSGVEWIGEIPSHWDFIPTKYFTVDKNGIQTGPFGTQLNTKDYVELGVKVMNQKTLINEDYEIGEEFISYEKFEELKGFEVIGGDLIMGSRGSFGNGKRTTFGKVSTVPNNLGDCVLHPCLIRIRLKEELILKNYYSYYVNDSTYFLEDVRNTSNSTTIEVIYGITLKDIRIPIPPLTEQQQIVSYLDEHTQLIDKTISIEERRIDTLKEYRQSLISEVVTGKRKVTTDE